MFYMFRLVLILKQTFNFGFELYFYFMEPLMWVWGWFLKFSKTSQEFGTQLKLLQGIDVLIIGFMINFLSQPHFWKSVRMTLTLPKWGLGSLLGLPKFQSSIVGVKTFRLEAFFMSLESYWSVNVENGLTWAIWNLQHKLWQKEGSGVKLTV
jgi:hypothetical protein